MDDANDTDDRRGSRPLPSQPQPWHAADEKKPARGGAPIGTHSLTGGGVAVGMPTGADAGAAERGQADAGERPAQPDPLAEPRAATGEILGRNP